MILGDLAERVGQLPRVCPGAAIETRGREPTPRDQEVPVRAELEERAIRVLDPLQAIRARNGFERRLAVGDDQLGRPVRIQHLRYGPRGLLQRHGLARSLVFRARGQIREARRQRRRDFPAPIELAGGQPAVAIEQVVSAATRGVAKRRPVRVDDDLEVGARHGRGHGLAVDEQQDRRRRTHEDRRGRRVEPGGRRAGQNLVRDVGEEQVERHFERLADHRALDRFRVLRGHRGREFDVRHLRRGHRDLASRQVDDGIARKVRGAEPRRRFTRNRQFEREGGREPLEIGPAADLRGVQRQCVTVDRALLREGGARCFGRRRWR